MSKILSADEVRKVAQLSRLSLTPQEIELYSTQLGQILEYVERLNELQTEELSPMVHAVELSNVFREDVVVPSLPVSEALQNAPKSDGRYFLVPQILANS